MTRRYFGTDGIRGTVGQEPMTAEFALRLASAAARVLAPNGGRAVIGKDADLRWIQVSWGSRLTKAFIDVDRLPDFRGARKV